MFMGTLEKEIVGLKEEIKEYKKIIFEMKSGI